MYMWKTKEGDSPMFLEVEIGEEETEVIFRGYVDPISKYPGLWCKLEPAKPKCVWRKGHHLWVSGCEGTTDSYIERRLPKFCYNCGGEIAVQ